MKTRLTIAKTLLWVAVAAATAAGISAISSMINADNDAKMLNLWVCVGYFTFALLFGMLAWQPRGNGNLWIVAFVNKLALTIAASFYLSNSDITGANDIVIWDGLLVLLLAVAFGLSRGKAEPTEEPTSSPS
jgi:hypothetical protein